MRVLTPFHGWRPWWVLSLVLLLAGCATRLAPAYDKVVAEGLASASVETMTLLASVSSGTQPETFGTREDKYNALIGRLDALALQAGARPMPSNRATEAINRVLDQRGTPGMAGDDGTPPSAHAIRKIAETLTKMRDTDRKQGIRPLEAQAFKGQASIYLDQAVTYENFLQR